MGMLPRLDTFEITHFSDEKANFFLESFDLSNEQHSFSDENVDFSDKKVE